MSISSLVTRVSYVGNGSTNIYDYTFRVFNEGDLLVTVTNTDTNVETTLTIATQYVVEGVQRESGGLISIKRHRRLA